MRTTSVLGAAWWVAFALTITLAITLNSMVVLAAMVAPLTALHLWLALKATGPS